MIVVTESGSRVVVDTRGGNILLSVVETFIDMMPGPTDVPGGDNVLYEDGTSVFYEDGTKLVYLT